MHACNDATLRLLTARAFAEHPGGVLLFAQLKGIALCVLTAMLLCARLQLPPKATAANGRLGEGQKCFLLRDRTAKRQLVPDGSGAALLGCGGSLFPLPPPVTFKWSLPKHFLLAACFPSDTKPRAFQNKSFRGKKKKKRNSSDPARTHAPLLLRPWFGAAQAKGRVSRSNFPWMQGTMEPRVVFAVQRFPSSTFCSSTAADKGSVHAQTGPASLHPAVRGAG